jgi:putative (di)nucleoside polyphosphate hydrolase
MSRYESLPYRPCVGLAVLNGDGRVFIGRRLNGPEHIDATHVWQMPQGGIDPGEDPWPAAQRELYEETNIRSVEKLGKIKDWLSYDIPPEIAGEAWNGKYRGQTQRWYARSTSPIPRAVTSLNSRSGAGSRSRTFPSWSCRSSGRSTSGW